MGMDDPFVRLHQENRMVQEKTFQTAAGKSAAPGERKGPVTSPDLVVGIGAAKGAWKSLRKILAGIPSGRGVAVVLLYHPQLSARNPLRLLQRHAALSVVEAVDGMSLLPDRIHVMPPDRFLNVTSDRLTHSEPVHCNGVLMPIDHFFCSLADDRKKRCCGIVLSGAGSDGTLGLSEIRAAGGRTIVENPREAPLPDMPQSAVDAGTVDMVLPAGEIAGEVALWAGQISSGIPGHASSNPPEGLREIIEILRLLAGQDFSGYKPATLERRIRRRMALSGIETWEAYVARLSGHPDEARELHKDLLIGVTEFFRQPVAWETLERKVIAPIIGNAAPGAVIRIWIPGCSSGKEVYSLAMLLADQARVVNGEIDFQIFATDVDHAALSLARSGIYRPEEIEPGVPPERLNRFFARRDDRYQVIKALREHIIFAVQNLTADPPFSRMDLIVCRNLLIYLDRSMQKRIIALFHLALHEAGFLFLGNAETVGDSPDLFKPVSKKWRIYRRIGAGRSAMAEIPVQPASYACTAAPRTPAASMPRQSLTATAQQALLSRFAPACVMIDRKLQVLYTHGAVENYLTLPSGEVTTLVVDMAREGLRTRLRAAIGRCIEKNRNVSFTARTLRGRRSVPVKATVSPLKHPRGIDGLLLITFEEQRLTPAKPGEPAADPAGVRQLADELKTTREELQSTIDQLEGANDQLKASNEEVIAANEELQSANEEMETSKEELQSLNDELNTANLRLHEKVDELEIANNDVLNFLASASIATLFLDKTFRIKRYTPAMTQLMSLIPSDAGRPIGDVLMRFSDAEFMSDMRRVLVDLTPISREVLADDGRWHIRRIMPYRTQDDRIEGVVVTFVDVADLKGAEEELRESRRRLAMIVDSIADGFFTLDRKWRFTRINDAALAHFGKSADDVIGCTLFEVFPAVRGTAFETNYLKAMESGEPVHFETRSTVIDMMMEVHAYPGPENLTVLFRDITERHRLAQALEKAHERAAWLARFPGENPNPVVRASADGKILYANPAAAQHSIWACVMGAALPGGLLPLVSQAVEANREIQRDVRMGERVYSVSVTPFHQESYVNLYGRDITVRTIAEAALRESERKSATLLNAADESIWLFGLNGEVLAANATAARRMGKTVDEVVGGQWGDLLNADLRKSWGEKIDEVVRTGGPVRFEDERAGIVFDHAFYPARDAAGNIMGIAGFSRDVTEQKRAEKAIGRSEERLKRAQEIAHLGSWELELAGNRLIWSDEVYRIFGLKPQEFSATYEAFLERVHPDDRPAVDAAYSRSIRENQDTYEIEHRVVRKDNGEVRIVHERCQHYRGEGGAIIRSVGMVHDITEQKEIESKVQRQGELLGAVNRILSASLRPGTEEALGQACLEVFQEVTGSGIGFIGIIGPEGLQDLAVSNPGWEACRVFDALGHRRLPGNFKIRGLYGRVIQDRKGYFTNAPAVHPDAVGLPEDHPPLHAFLGVPLLSREKVIGMIALGNRKGGYTPADLEGMESLAPVVVEAFQRKQTEEALNRRSELLAAANRELESFSYSVSHDLQSPLRAIDGYSRMILRKHAGCLDEDGLAKFNVIRANTQRMSLLIDDLLAFSRLGKAHLSSARLDMDHMVRETWEEIRAANPDRSMKLTIGALPPAAGDRGLIRQVLVNLIANAVKFTRHRPEALIEVTGSVTDSQCVFSVRDNGVGFDMAYHDKMFGVFQRLHSSEEFEGTGVGLAIVQRIIHRHGGRVWAEGKIGHGACLYFSLPSADGTTSVS